jgi:hypothetical protein
MIISVSSTHSTPVEPTGKLVLSVGRLNLYIRKKKEPDPVLDMEGGFHPCPVEYSSDSLQSKNVARKR